MEGSDYVPTEPMVVTFAPPPTDQERAIYAAERAVLDMAVKWEENHKIGLSQLLAAIRAYKETKDAR